MLLSELPDYVEVILLPGNHDAVRKSLPQEPISPEYAETLHENKKIHFFWNPARLLMHGVEAYIGHGKVLDEILSQVPGMDFHNPVEGMELLLKCRHPHGAHPRPRSQEIQGDHPHRLGRMADPDPLPESG
jgi:DNA polymerase II small subunit